jgi:hypothetical protein
MAFDPKCHDLAAHFLPTGASSVLQGRVHDSTFRTASRRSYRSSATISRTKSKRPGERTKQTTRFSPGG